MKKILLIVLIVLIAGSLWAKEGTGSQETREFEFELTDLYYPLLNEAQTKELSRRMINAQTWGFYEGNITTIYSDEFRKTFNILRRPPKSTTTDTAYKWIGSIKSYIKDGKLRFRVPKEVIIDDCIGTEMQYKGAIPLTRIQISMPIHYLGDVLGERLCDGDETIGKADCHYHTSVFSIVPYTGERVKNDAAGFYAKQHSYIKNSSVPVPNISKAQLWAVGKISEINKDGTVSSKTLIANESSYGSDHLSDSPLLPYNKKIWSLPSPDYDPKDTKNIIAPKNFPINADSIKAAYRSRGALEQFTIYAAIKYRSADKHDENLTNIKIAQTKIGGKLYRIEGYVPDSKNSLGSNCKFEYGIQFLDDQEKRYLGRPKDINNTWQDWQYDAITDGNISAFTALEKDVRQWFTGDQDEAGKLAACQTLIAHAKHILTASNAQLNREFGETYKSVRTQIEKINHERIDHAQWLTSRNGEYVTKNPNGEVLKALYKEGKLVNAALTYPNGNIFRYSYTDKPSLASCKYSGDEVNNITMTYPNGNVYEYKIDDRERKCDDNLPNLNTLSWGKLTTYKGDKSRTCSARKFINGKAEDDGDSSQKDIPIIRTKFRDGIANGYTTLSMNDRGRYIYLGATAKDGRFEGSANVDIVDLQSNLSKHNVTFTSGLITDRGTLEAKYVDIVNAYLKSLYPIECDVSKPQVILR